MLMPRRVTYRKQHRGRRAGAAQTGNTVAFGEWGLQAQTTAWVDARQIESARRAITGSLKRGGKVWIRVFPDKPVTKKPPEVTLGGGKGAVDHYVFPVRPGRMLFEMDGVSAEVAREALRRASHKLPMKTKIISK